MCPTAAEDLVDVFRDPEMANDPELFKQTWVTVCVLVRGAERTTHGEGDMSPEAGARERAAGMVHTIKGQDRGRPVAAGSGEAKAHSRSLQKQPHLGFSPGSSDLYVTNLP